MKENEYSVYEENDEHFFGEHRNEVPESSKVVNVVTTKMNVNK